MGIIDKIKGEGHTMSDSMKARFNELRKKEQDGSIDDSGRLELAQMREQFTKKD